MGNSQGLFEVLQGEGKGPDNDWGKLEDNP